MEPSVASPYPSDIVGTCTCSGMTVSSLGCLAPRVRLEPTAKDRLIWAETNKIEKKTKKRENRHTKRENERESKKERETRREGEETKIEDSKKIERKEREEKVVRKRVL